MDKYNGERLRDTSYLHHEFSNSDLTQPDLAPLTLRQRCMRDAGFVVEQEIGDK